MIHIRYTYIINRIKVDFFLPTGIITQLAILENMVVASSYQPYDSILLPPDDALEELVSYCHRVVLKLFIGVDAKSLHMILDTDTDGIGKFI